MCFLAYCPAGTSFSEEELSRAWSLNPDGAGFVWLSDNGKLQTYKTLSLQKLLAAYRRQLNEGLAYRPHAIHLRYATHGAKNIENVHPVKIGSDSLLLHNGILDTPVEPKRSDTRVFAEDYLAALPPLWYDDAALVDLVSSFADGSKLVVATSNPRAQSTFYIINESLGSWEENGRWVSNSSHRPYNLSVGKGAGCCDFCGEDGLKIDYDLSIVYCERCDACVVCGDKPVACSCFIKTQLGGFRIG